MKRSFDETSSTPEGIDIALHARVCLKYFQLVVNKTSSSSASADNVKEAISLIYEDATNMLKTLIASDCLEIWSGNLSNEHPTSSSSTGSTQLSSGLTLVKDLILVTSFICSNSHEYHNQVLKQTAPSSSSSVASTSSEFYRKNTASPFSCLIAVAPYWAVATCISQTKTNQDLLSKLRNACKTILTGKLTSRAHLEISEEILLCTNHLPASFTKSVLINQLLARIRRALRTYLKNVLLFSVILSISIHSELSITLHQFQMGLNQSTIDHLLSVSDDNCIDIVRMVVHSAPQLALQTDTGSVGATPLAYASSYRCSNGLDSEFLEYKLALGLCKVLTEVAPSALAVSDRLGMLPLHHAARKGHSSVLAFLSTNFFFTVPLRDSSGKSALHHALISWKQHNEDAILRLAKLSPKLLKESNRIGTAFDLLDYAQKHCPESLFNGLHDINAFDSNLRINITIPKALSYAEKRTLLSSPSCNGSTRTDAELSESEMSNEDHHLDNDSIDSEDLQERCFEGNRKDQDLMQYADTLLMLQAAKTTNLDDKYENPQNGTKRQRIY
eukprot:gene3335-3557_t